MTFDRYVAARIEHARERIREGGEIAEVRCLVSRLCLISHPSRVMSDLILTSHPSQIDIVMQKEARDGEGSVMSRTELRDEVFLANFASQETSTYVRNMMVVGVSRRRKLTPLHRCFSSSSSTGPPNSGQSSICRRTLACSSHCIKHSSSFSPVRRNERPQLRKSRRSRLLVCPFALHAHGHCFVPTLTTLSLLHST